MKNTRIAALFLCVALVAILAGCRQPPKPGRRMTPELLLISRTSQYGPYIADGDGRALYLLEGEPENRSTCYGKCADEWPPLLAIPGKVGSADPVVRGELIDTIKRRDGTYQVTYNGHALYYYHGDRQAGQIDGHDDHDEWGGWYLVHPDGTALGHH